MKYATIADTDIKVSKICLGGMSFGVPYEDFLMWTLDQKKTTEIIGHALDLGINFIDTANVYAHGTSEQYIAQSLKDLKISRDKVVIASKVFWNEGQLSKEAILREIDGTLKRLDTDYLDIYYIHRFDYGTPIEETMETLDSLVKTGKVRVLGASAMYAYQFHNMIIAAEKNGWTKFKVMQNHYNLLYREDERELIPLCDQLGVSRVPYSPLASGHLAHVEWRTESSRSKTDMTMRGKYDQAQENDEKIIARVAELADRYGVSMAQVAIAWVLAKGVTAPIVGATSPVHFDNAAAAVDFELSADDCKYLEEPYEPH
ncbi:MAG: aldo/keto reductase [Burkholderiales bacterium]|nr:aldo/keto reductase [Burkholderiales bacterium]